MIMSCLKYRFARNMRRAAAWAAVLLVPVSALAQEDGYPFRWSNFALAISISPADGKPAVLVDDVSVVYRPGMAVGPVGCGRMQ